MTITVAAFYQFIPVPDPRALRAELLPVAEALGLKGTLILASEGVNGTLAGESAAIDGFLDRLGQANPPIDRLELKRAPAESIPFRRLKVRVKREIVAIAAAEADPTVSVGTYVDPADWNALIGQPDVTLIDTRNAFEVALGSFAGAVDPRTARFSEFPGFVDAHLDPAVHRRVAMFCTGGIRCEKATALLKARGFAEVYHLKGGILGYLARISAGESRWNGSCFVFDERVAVGRDDLV
jgi:UPF0176 protein